MPTYPYECPKCGHEGDTFKPVSEYRSLEFCPKCGFPMARVYGPVASPDTAFHKPIEMFSIAGTAGEMQQLRERLPDTQFTNQGVPLARSRAEKMRLLKVAGFRELN